MIISLDKLKIKDKGIVREIKVCDEIKRRLLDLGLIKNTEIKKVLKSPLGDPSAYLIRGSIIALRNEDARKIFIKYDDLP